MRSKLSLSFTLPTPLGNKLLNFLSVKLAPAEMKGSDKTDRDFQVGILNEDRRMNTDSGHSESSPAGARKARFHFFYIIFFYCKLMDNRDKFYFFNKVMSSSVPVLFTL